MNCPYPTYDFCLWRGEDKELFFAFSYDDGGQKLPMIMDGCSFLMTLGLKYTKKDIDRLSTENGRLVPGVLEGGEFRPASEGANVLRAVFPHDATQAMPEGDAQFDLIKIDPEDRREVLLAGKVTVHGGVSYD